MIFFEFDGVHSREYGLVIGNGGGGGNRAVSTFADVEIFSDRPGRRVAPFFYGTRIEPGLAFGLEVYAVGGRRYSLDDVRAVQRWLFGRASALSLKIFDGVNGNRTYNCFLTRPQIIKHGNVVMGWRFNVECTAPYALGDEVETVFDCTGDTLTTIRVNNLSDVEDYLYPRLEIFVPGEGTIRITNTSDTREAFEIVGIGEGGGGDVVFVDNDLRTMKAGSLNKIFRRFNRSWLGLVPGENVLVVDGLCILTVRLRFKFAHGGY